MSSVSSTSSGSSASTAPLARRSRTLMVTYLGSVVRRLDDWMPIAGTVTLMTRCGLDAPSVRTAVFRFKERGWLASEQRHGARGYRITDEALATLAAGDELIWGTRQPADIGDGWCVINASIPESARASRHKLRAHLAHLGFGNVGTAMWIAPSRSLKSARQAIAELDLEPYASIFVGEYAGARDLAALVQDSWDLDDLNAQYRDFIATHAAAAAGKPSGVEADEAAFVAYLTAVDQWRTLPFRDPGLPLEVLPADWCGAEAGTVFGSVVDRLESAALRHAGTVWPSA